MTANTQRKPTQNPTPRRTDAVVTRGNHDVLAGDGVRRVVHVEWTPVAALHKRSVRGRNHPHTFGELLMVLG